MSDVAMAQSYVATIGGKGSVKTILSRAYLVLSEMFPHRDAPQNRWTERRVRAFWNKEAAYVEFREMAELHRAAEREKEARLLIKQAREEHAAFVAQTASIRALLEHQDEAFHSHHLEGLRSLDSRVDRAGTEGRLK